MAEKPAKSSESKAGGNGEPKPRGLLRRLTRRLAKLVVLLLLVPVLILPLYRYVNPPLTSVMVWKRLGGASIVRHWVDLEDISPNLVRAVLVSEDARFCAHSGVDLKEVEAVLEDIGEGTSPRGASTITMQVVKNLFLWSDRSFIRKILEVPLALYTELVLPKRRIMEIYLNIVEWDRGVYGAEAAAQRYFRVSAGRLSRSQAAHLAVTLPAPASRDAARPSRQMRKLSAIVARRADLSGAYVTCVLD
jgi:monofunctional biosynthetic peptidoglycan transglycosylase